MKNLFKSLFVGTFALVMAHANADPIGGPNNIDCTTENCFGSLITLEYEAVTATNYKIHLFIDTTDYTGAATNWIAAVAIKPASDATGSLIGNPSGTWNYLAGGLNNGACNGNGAGFMCASTPGMTALTDGSTYEWVFDVTSPGTKWDLAALGSHVKVDYVNDSDCANGCNTSADITLQNGGGPPQEIPEPQTLGLLGLGLLGLALIRRRRIG